MGPHPIQTRSRSLCRRAPREACCQQILRNASGPAPRDSRSPLPERPPDWRLPVSHCLTEQSCHSLVRPSRRGLGLVSQSQPVRQTRQAFQPHPNLLSQLQRRTNRQDLQLQRCRSHLRTRPQHSPGNRHPGRRRPGRDQTRSPGRPNLPRARRVPQRRLRARCASQSLRPSPVLFLPSPRFLPILRFRFLRRRSPVRRSSCLPQPR